MKRVQRQRTKGWRMPPNTVYVGRPSKWGNAYQGLVTQVDAVEAFRAEHVSWNHDHLMRWLAPLRGRNLACWCPLTEPCHADVLLELVGAVEPTEPEVVA